MIAILSRSPFGKHWNSETFRLTWLNRALRNFWFLIPENPTTPIQDDVDADVTIYDCPDCDARFFDQELLLEHQAEKLKPVSEAGPSEPNLDQAETEGSRSEFPENVEPPTAEHSGPLVISSGVETPENVETKSRKVKPRKVVAQKVSASKAEKVSESVTQIENQESTARSSTHSEKEQIRPTIRLVPLAKLLKENVPVCNYENIHTPDSPRPPINSSRSSTTSSNDKLRLKSSSLKKVSVVLTRLTPEEVQLMTSNRNSDENSPAAASRSRASDSQVVHSDFRSLLTTLTRKAKENADIKCGECSRVFGDHAKLLLHVKVDHGAPATTENHSGPNRRGSGSTASQVRPNAREKKFLCSVCDKTFTSRGHLSRHSRIFHNKELWSGTNQALAKKYFLVECSNVKFPRWY